MDANKSARTLKCRPSLKGIVCAIGHALSRKQRDEQAGRLPLPCKCLTPKSHKGQNPEGRKAQENLKNEAYAKVMAKKMSRAKGRRNLSAGQLARRQRRACLAQFYVGMERARQNNDMPMVVALNGQMIMKKIEIRAS